MADFFSNFDAGGTTFVGGVAVTTFREFASLQIVPENYSKYVIMFSADSNRYLERVVGYVDGATIFDQKLCENPSAIAAVTLSPGITSSLSIKVDESAYSAGNTYTITNIHCAAFGVEKWKLIESTADVAVSGSTGFYTSLIEHYYQPEEQDVIIFSYGEITKYNTNTLSALKCSFEDSLDERGLLIQGTNETARLLSSPAYSQLGFCSAKRITFNKDLKKFRWSGLVSSTVAVTASRLRNIIIPVNQAPFGTITSSSFKSQLFSEHSDGATASIEIFSDLSPTPGVTNLLVNFSQAASDGGVTGLIRYEDLSGATTFAGLTIAEVVTKASENLWAKRGQGYHSTISRAYKPTEADIIDKKLGFRIEYGILDTDDGVNLVSYENSSICIPYYGKSTATAPSVTTNYNITPYQNIRTLVEVYKKESISRYCLESDCYLMEGINAGQFISFYDNGNIDSESVLSMSVVGQDLLLALQNNETALVEDLFNMETGVPSSGPTGTTTEYLEYNNHEKLYAKQLLSSVTIDESAPEALSGVQPPSSVSLEFDNTSNNFFTEHSASSLFGALIIVKRYDLENNTLRVLFSGRIDSIESGPTAKISATAPDTSSLDKPLPSATVVDVGPTDSDNPGHLPLSPVSLSQHIPVFFGIARRVALPNLHRYHGSDDTSPSNLDAFSDYAVGGVLDNSRFPTVQIGATQSALGFYRNWVQITSSQEFNDKVNLIERGRYRLRDKDLNCIRFAARELQIPTQINGAGMPREGITSSAFFDSITSNYVNFSPVDTVDYINGYTKNSDYVDGGGGRIGWFNGPAASAAVTTSGLVTRASNTLVDAILAGETNGQFGNVLSIDAVIVAGVTYDKNVDYEVLSSSSYRTFEDLINWNVESHLVSRWEFSGSVEDAVTTSANNLDGITSGVQPVYDGGKTAIQFDTANSGYIGIAHGSITGSLDPGLTFGGRAVATVGNNNAGILSGCVIRKFTGTLGVNFAGYAVDIVSEADAGVPGGLTSKYIARATIGYGSGTEIVLYSNTGITLNDGGAHQIDLRFDRDQDYAYLFVDNTIESSSAIAAATTFESTGDFIIGGDPDSQFSQFYGRIYQAEFYSSGRAAPANATTYTVNWTAQKDSYEVTFTYLKSAASDPIQIQNGQDSIIGADLLVSGSDIVPEVATASVVGDTTTNFLWKLGENEVGYVVRLNKPLTTGTGWVLGTSGLGVSTILGAPAAASTSYMEISTAINVKFNDDFTVYACGSWLGSNQGNGMLFSKDYASAATPSYGVGITSGKAYGVIQIHDGTSLQKYEISGVSRIDDGSPHVIALSRKAGVLKLYVDGNEESSGISVPVSIGNAYNDEPLRIGSDAEFNGMWVGDVYFVGVLSYGVDKEFTAYQRDLLAQGVKGAFVRDTQGKDIDSTVINELATDMQSFVVSGLLAGQSSTLAHRLYLLGYTFYATKVLFGTLTSADVLTFLTQESIGKTQLHIPFIEGGGVTAKSRNLHRNPAITLKRLISDRIFGLGEKVSGESFDAAAVVFDDAEYKLDYVGREQVRSVDAFNDISGILGTFLKKDVKDRWTISLEENVTTVSDRFGYLDGELENIMSVDSLRFKNREEVPRSVTVNYRYMPDSTGTLAYHSAVRKTASDFGLLDYVVQAKHIYDHKTADTIADFLAKKAVYADRVLTFNCGFEGYNLKVRNVIEVTIPHLGISEELYRIVGISRDGSSVQVTCEPYNTAIYDFRRGSNYIDESIYAGVTT